MKKCLLFITIAFVLGTHVFAKDWIFDMGGLRNVSFNVPDDYECVFCQDSVVDGVRCLLKSSNGTELSITTILIDNFDYKEAKKMMPDSLIVPNATIIGREEFPEEPISRIIMTRNNDGSQLRHYVFFDSNGLVVIDAYNYNCDWNEADQIAQTFDSHIKWGKLLLLILIIIVGLVPCLIFGFAWSCWKNNKQKFWLYFIIAVLLIVVIALVFSIWRGVNFWWVLLVYLVAAMSLGYFFEHGGFIMF